MYRLKFREWVIDLKVTVEGFPAGPYSHVSVRVLPAGISVSH